MVSHYLAEQTLIMEMAETLDRCVDPTDEIERVFILDFCGFSERDIDRYGERAGEYAVHTRKIREARAA